MAGTLTISTLSDGTNSTSATNCIQGSAKAWVNFNGSGSASIRASYNVSSVTRNGTGDYTISFTNAMADTNYSTIGTCNINTSGSGYFLSAPFSTTSTASAVRVSTDSSASRTDMQFVSVAIFR